MITMDFKNCIPLKQIKNESFSTTTKQNKKKQTIPFKTILIPYIIRFELLLLLLLLLSIIIQFKNILNQLKS
jgi:hypothetical protein